MDKEWKPVNPCPCKNPIGNPADICVCEDSLAYSSQIVALKGFLGYLIATTDENNNYSPVKTHSEFESMLKELEEMEK